MTNTQRMSWSQVDPAALQAVLALEKYAQSSGLDRHLYELVKIRASQLNGCAYCLDMHTREAREAGEDQRRLDVIVAWREAAGLFTEAERAALALTEAVTQIGAAGVPDPVWEGARAAFSEKELVQLLIAISTINVWNRLAVSTHQQLPDVGA